MRRLLIGLLPWLAALAPVAAPCAESPFRVSAALSVSGAATQLVVSFTVPAKHYLYADPIGVEPVDPGVSLAPQAHPAPARKPDPFSGEVVGVFDRDVSLAYAVAGAGAQPLRVRVQYQGCNDQLCFMPQSETLAVPPGGETARPAPAAAPAAPAAPAGTPAADGRLDRFSVAGQAEGYLPRQAFLEFLGRAEAGEGGGGNRLQRVLEQRGVLAALLLILVLGAALNLTPCVLPMIPVNLAIIGAGAGAGSRARGFALGGVYGLAMALVYGALGLAAVYGGARFGTLNSAPWFNAAVAVVFVVLSLAMFDVFAIDLSRFQRAGGARSGSFATAFVMGAVAALLAGACVAPVVVWVLLLAADQHARGNPLAPLLPFLLGLGMGLPWPFLGAGLAFLPKPGRWMDRLKKGFGVLILGFALYYGYLAYRLHADRQPARREEVAAAQAAAAAEGGWLTSLDEALAAAEASGQPVFIDFWATWCKNCLAMDESTFRDPEVRRRLERYVRVKIQAENLRAPETRALLDRFRAIGLPTYVVLAPRPAPSGGAGEARP